VFGLEIRFKSKSTLLLSGSAQRPPFSVRPTPACVAHARCPTPLLERQTLDWPPPPPAARLAGCQPPHAILPHMARSSRGPPPSSPPRGAPEPPSPRVETITACRSRGHRTPSSSPSISSALNRLASLQCTRELPPPPVDALGPFGAPRPFPLHEFNRRTTVSPVSGDDCRPHASLLTIPAHPTPHLPHHLTDLYGRCWTAPALDSHTPPSERCCAGLSPPPHPRPTSSVSCTISLLARCLRPSPSVLHSETSPPVLNPETSPPPIRQWATAGRDTAWAVHAVTARRASAAAPGWHGPARTIWAVGWAKQGRPPVCKCYGRGPNADPLLFNAFPIPKNPFTI
jgi:hypothetical protein